MAWTAFDSAEIGANDWCVDSGVTSHMIYDKSMFIEYANYTSTLGTAKNDINLNVIGRGKVCCKINGQNTTFEGVLHIPEFKANLLSPEK
ncbi:hypothetical protein BGT96224_3246, partial [Blumeria graminis f. sp. tritici 96224]